MCVDDGVSLLAVVYAHMKVYEAGRNRSFRPE
jgi:hypothetical protein